MTERKRLILYHADPYQSNNIAAENPEIVKKMSDFYEAWWEKVEHIMEERMK